MRLIWIIKSVLRVQRFVFKTLMKKVRDVRTETPFSIAISESAQITDRCNGPNRFKSICSIERNPSDYFIPKYFAN
jgi:hypothetical protein